MQPDAGEAGGLLAGCSCSGRLCGQPRAGSACKQGWSSSRAGGRGDKGRHLLQRRPQLRSGLGGEVGLQVVVGLVGPEQRAGGRRQVSGEAPRGPLRPLHAVHCRSVSGAPSAARLPGAPADAAARKPVWICGSKRVLAHVAPAHCQVRAHSHLHRYKLDLLIPGKG